MAESKRLEEEQELRKVFGDDFFPDDDNSSFADDVEEEFFYLWDEHQTLFEIFQVAYYYLDKDRFDSAILLALLKEKGLPISDSLLNLQFILDGYLTEKYKGAPNGRQLNQNSND